jgi:hypothetical protein
MTPVPIGLRHYLTDGSPHAAHDAFTVAWAVYDNSGASLQLMERKE